MKLIRLLALTLTLAGVAMHAEIPPPECFGPNCHATR